MDFQAIYTLAAIVLMITALSFNWGSVDFVLFATLGVLLFGGIITPKEALAGFSNQGVITVALLFMISEAIRLTGALNHIVYNFLGTYHTKKNIPSLLLKMMTPIAFLSAFLNNTAIVAIFTPVIKKWTDNARLPASKFFIPLSYATVLGGCITLIGTSTNLTVHGLMIANGMEGFSVFELAKVGIPCTIIGLFYLAFVGEKLLPNHQSMSEIVSEHSREYVMEMRVKKECPLVGKDIKQAGLRNLSGLFLIDIERNGNSLGPVASHEIIRAEDRLMFAGVTSAVLDLQEIPGLVPSDEMFERDFANIRSHLVEAVVSSGSPILGKTVKECQFRGKYGAGVVAVHRNGERVSSKIGDIILQAGDTLLLFAPEDFVDAWKNSTDFYLISHVKEMPPAARKKGYWVLAITVLMVCISFLGESGWLKWGGQEIEVLHAAVVTFLIFLAMKAISGRDAKRALNLEVLVAIACSFGISMALQKTGLADIIAKTLIQWAGQFGPYGILAAIYLLTNLLTELMSNNSAAALVFPVTLSVSSQLGVHPMPLIVAMTIAASYGFSTPFGYQTHLMVQGAGGYKFADYFKVGPLLNLICFAIAVVLIPFFWKF